MINKIVALFISMLKTIKMNLNIDKNSKYINKYKVDI